MTEFLSPYMYDPAEDADQHQTSEELGELPSCLREEVCWEEILKTYPDLEELADIPYSEY